MTPSIDLRAVDLCGGNLHNAQRLMERVEVDLYVEKRRKQRVAIATRNRERELDRRERELQARAQAWLRGEPNA